MGKMDTNVKVSLDHVRAPAQELQDQDVGSLVHGLSLSVRGSGCDTTISAVVTWDGKNWRDEGGPVR